MSTDESMQSTETVAAASNASYQVMITMNQQTVQALQAGGFSLYGFKAVRGAGQGLPLVWLATRNFAPSTPVSWQQQYQAYSSNSQLMPNAQIMMMSTAGINLGQTAQVQNNGMIMVTGQGSPGAISILNQGQSPYTVGLAQPTDNRPNPYCAFSLYGNMMNVLVPVEKVLLMFSAMPVNPGTAVDRSFSPGLLIDLTSASQRTVSFDINTGWSAQGAPWAQQVTANSDLVPLLIQR